VGLPAEPGTRNPAPGTRNFFIFVNFNKRARMLLKVSVDDTGLAELPDF
jgi:hypothetical protein